MDLVMEDVLFALDVANGLRALTELDPLKTLPFGSAIPNDASGCVLARAFNHSCRVDYENAVDIDDYPDDEKFSRQGSVFFTEEAPAKALATELEVSVISQSEQEFYVPLPDRVTEIAKLFDTGQGQDMLDELIGEIGWDDELINP